MKLYILRHGKTEWNRLGKVLGCVDIPLAEEGISLAAKVGGHLKEVPLISALPVSYKNKA